MLYNSYRLTSTTEIRLPHINIPNLLDVTIERSIPPIGNASSVDLEVEISRRQISGRQNLCSWNH